MNNPRASRRQSLKKLAALPLLSLPGIPVASTTSDCVEDKKKNPFFSYCLNTSCIMGQKLGLVREMETAAAAGFDGIEIWIPTLQAYLDQGGSLKEIKKRKEDLGLKIENAIGFAQWIVDDASKRKAALEQARKEMEWLAQLGCSRLAAPPAGATEQVGLNLYHAAERFHQLVELGLSQGVIPQLEVWGFSKNLSRLSEVLFVAAQCGHPQTRILPDAYHLHKGGSDVDALKLLHPQAVEIFHINDYPPQPGPEAIQDKDRIYPGDGVAPLNTILQSLANQDYPTVLSLELFNRQHWEQDPLQVAKTGLKKMKESVQGADL